ncbi:hypothetical protein CcaverHIS002_0307660 [Cutaneotrichosporon cavernicola]|uniref:Uncharacterized protein n=1 Tax=Cutaneotrichosporon cavernicola TaxID=279322 RepID=A0AA48I3Y4_9TREE|nr:uncharacterized protein CcaverHIS019_0307560 [Cutaneotrichosporon cavernicola]BEI82898.1 hypothetical protein CcaverHIS002_0307660 [Cutaneotrichosporon cavernicola]BEI90686.1 hypothetical protein CcaverHIS019_0307560 [Cutaneotrichosporon cavernicola]BEI98464.1 hypothetical protein CcaverHIS631_0307630 [Cutaneotrichosporon cavernicola]BEJ06237.1 hypothetical protein CcaverHIS641_0307590 [Cutaneotrichosporon cavernicola]
MLVDYEGSEYAAHANNLYRRRDYDFEDKNVSFLTLDEYVKSVGDATMYDNDGHQFDIEPQSRKRVRQSLGL